MKIGRSEISRFTHLSRRKKLLAGAVAVVLVGSAIGGSLFTYIHLSRVNAPLPSLKPHADIPIRPMTTFADTLNQELPADSVELPLKCPIQQGDWINTENQNPGLALTPTDWTNFKLTQESGSVLWIDKQSVTCGDRIGIHASLYPTNADGSLNKAPRTFEVLRVGCTTDPARAWSGILGRSN